MFLVVGCTQAATTTLTTTTAAALPDPIASEGATVVALGEREQARLELLGGPDWLAEGIGSIWVKADRGEVLRVDPFSNGVMIWVLNGAGDQLLGIDPASNAVGDTVDLGTRCTDVAGSDEFIWAACPIEGTAVRVAPDGEVTRLPVNLPGARQVTIDGWVFVGFESGIAQINAETMEVAVVYDVIPGLGGAVRAGHGNLWERRQPGPFLTRIDPTARAVVEVIEADGITSGGDVLPAFDSVWATAFDDNLLVRLVP